ncbi:MAG: ribosome maturation factor RimP [Alphaproteobacteria bacterium]|nr:ribosome maturation factor RimP [Alphaproteobacteria bacterium]
MKKTPLEEKIESIVTPVINDMGLRLVCVKIIGEGGSRNVQIMAEDPATRNLSVEKCAEVSRSVSALLDVEDPIDGHYRLEVSSPGIDRPLLTLEDFKNYEGYEARVETDMPISTGQKRFKGILQGIENNLVKINTEQGEAEIPFASIAKAKLVLTDKLLKQTAST